MKIKDYAQNIAQEKNEALDQQYAKLHARQHDIIFQSITKQADHRDHLMLRADCPDCIALQTDRMDGRIERKSNEKPFERESFDLGKWDSDRGINTDSE